MIHVVWRLSIHSTRLLPRKPVLTHVTTGYLNMDPTHFQPLSMIFAASVSYCLCLPRPSFVLVDSLFYRTSSPFCWLLCRLHQDPIHSGFFVHVFTLNIGVAFSIWRLPHVRLSTECVPFPSEGLENLPPCLRLLLMVLSACHCCGSEWHLGVCSVCACLSLCWTFWSPLSYKGYVDHRCCVSLKMLLVVAAKLSNHVWIYISQNSKFMDEVKPSIFIMWG